MIWYILLALLAGVPTAIVVLLVVVAFAICAALAVTTRQFSHVSLLYLKSTAIFVAGIPVTIAGWFVVALALPFRIYHPETKQAFTDPRQLPGMWQLVTLQYWAKLWDNVFDGAWGDKRGWWNTYAFNTFGKYCYEFLAMWWWLAVRNPANYWSRVVTGCDVSKCVITRLAGQDLADEDHPGWSFLVATERDTGREFHLLQFWFNWPNGTHGILGKFGWKIKLSHNDTVYNIDASELDSDSIKGSVYRVSPWKAK